MHTSISYVSVHRPIKKIPYSMPWSKISHLGNSHRTMTCLYLFCQTMQMQTHNSIDGRQSRHEVIAVISCCNCCGICFKECLLLSFTCRSCCNCCGICFKGCLYCLALPVAVVVMFVVLCFWGKSIVL